MAQGDDGLLNGWMDMWTLEGGDGNGTGINEREYVSSWSEGRKRTVYANLKADRKKKVPSVMGQQ